MDLNIGFTIGLALLVLAAIGFAFKMNKLLKQ